MNAEAYTAMRARLKGVIERYLSAHGLLFPDGTADPQDVFDHARPIYAALEESGHLPKDASFESFEEQLRSAAISATTFVIYV